MLFRQCSSISLVGSDFHLAFSLGQEGSEVSFMHDSLGLHRIENPSNDEALGPTTSNPLRDRYGY